MPATSRASAYIAGPMTGLPDYNYAAFYAAEVRLSEYVTVLNPAKHFGGDQTRPREQYLSAAIGVVLHSADWVVVLPGWQNSPGARVEVHVAQSIGKPIYALEDFIEACDNDVEPHALAINFELHRGSEVAPELSENYLKAWSDSDAERHFGSWQPWPNLESAPLPEDELSPRADVLAEAQRLITGDRNNQYGPPTQDFKRSADMAQALGYRRLDPNGEIVDLVPSDVAILISCVKLSRLMHQRTKRDNWTDLAGYAGCGYECSTEEGN